MRSARLRFVTVRVKTTTGSCISIDCSRLNSVLQLKEDIHHEIAIPIQRQRLVFQGKVLCDELTLAYYGIDNMSTIYLVQSREPPEKPRPYTMVNQLLGLLDELPLADSRRYTEITLEINRLIHDPILTAYARINLEIQQILEDAVQILDTSERPMSKRTQRFLAQSRDIVFDQFEASPDGLRLVQSLLDDDSDDDDQNLTDTTVIHYQRKLQTKALPNPWRRKRNVFQDSALRMSLQSGSLSLKSPRHLPSTEDNVPLGKVPTFEGPFCSELKAKFGQQLKTLKKMGFNDENVILQALSETNGNVQKAARILQTKFYSSF